MATDQVQVAVLDDYAGVSVPHFDALDRSAFSVTVFNDTLQPWGHPDTPQTVKEALVHRLEPFQVICKLTLTSPPHPTPLTQPPSPPSQAEFTYTTNQGTMRERTPFPKDLVARLPNLRLLLTTGFRNASLDLPALSAKNVPVAGTLDRITAAKVARVPPGAATSSTTEHTAALILGAARGLARDDAAVKSGLWQTGFALGLSGKTLGIVGLGRLGAALARTMHLGFGMRIAAWSTNLTQEAADQKAREMGLPVEIPGTNGDKTFRVVDRATLFSESDVVSIHLVLSDRSRGLVAADDLRRMKKSAILVNTSRGPLVKHEDIIEVLRKGGIHTFAVDVFELEPLPADSEWRTIKWGEDGRSNVLLTPHMGYVEKETLNDWYAQQVENIQRWHSGQELANVIS